MTGKAAAFGGNSNTVISVKSVMFATSFGSSAQPIVRSWPVRAKMKAWL